MNNFYAKQYQAGAKVKVHVFKWMQERDAWVQENYNALGARQCSAVEAKQLAKPHDWIEQ